MTIAVLGAPVRPRVQRMDGYELGLGQAILGPEEMESMAIALEQFSGVDRELGATVLLRFLLRQRVILAFLCV